MSTPTGINQTVDPPQLQSPRISAPDIVCRSTKEATEEKPVLDIEHVQVNDDPHEWSHIRKTVTLWIVSTAALIGTLASNIQSPTNALIRQDLRATDLQISWSMAAFIIVQGNFPLVWSAASEIKGRKLVFIAAATVFASASAILANARTINVFIGMRVAQAAGSSAAMAISAATLADIYETHERGTMMGIFYAAPLLGPALAPILGGCLSQAFGWRACFYFLTACGGIILGAYIFLFNDTFRIERSSTYQAALRRRTIASGEHKSVPDLMAGKSKAGTGNESREERAPSQPGLIEDGTARANVDSGLNDVRLSFSDINPFPPLWQIMHRKNNIAILLANGLVFAFGYCLAYTCARTLSKYYRYEPLSVGIVLLSFGAGSVGGSVIGGRWSDHMMMKLTNKNEGKRYPEMRLKSATLAMVWLPPSVIGYGWAAEKRIDVGVICLMLFLCGFFSIWMYSSTLAYLVDANPGRSCSAVATNSSFRGTLAFVSTMVSIPVQNAIGDGWLYTGFGALMIVMELLIVLVLYKGASWREESA